jgi:hypothetical protein
MMLSSLEGISRMVIFNGPIGPYGPMAQSSILPSSQRAKAGELGGGRTFLILHAFLVGGGESCMGLHYHKEES